MRSAALTVVAVGVLAAVGGCAGGGRIIEGGEAKVGTLAVAPAEGGAATRPAEKRTYVLVHGAWAGAFEWKNMAERLQARGHTVYRPTHTGQGERSHLSSPDVDLNTHITDVTNVLLFENLHDVVLVGHSYGGMVITGVADRVPDRIKTLVYVDAFLPQNGESLNSARPASTTAPAGTTRPAGARGAGGRGPQLQERGGLVWNGNWPREGRVPPYNVPQSAKTFSQPIELKNADATRKIPAVYLLTVDPGRRPEEDTFHRFYQRAQERGWTVWTMAADHVPNVSRPAELTKLLEDAPAAAKATAAN